MRKAFLLKDWLGIVGLVYALVSVNEYAMSISLKVKRKKSWLIIKIFFPLFDLYSLYLYNLVYYWFFVSKRMINVIVSLY